MYSSIFPSLTVTVTNRDCLPSFAARTTPACGVGGSGRRRRRSQRRRSDGWMDRATGRDDGSRGGKTRETTRLDGPSRARRRRARERASGDERRTRRGRHDYRTFGSPSTFAAPDNGTRFSSRCAVSRHALRVVVPFDDGAATMACVARASFAAFASSSSSSSIPKTGKGGSFVDHCHGVEIKGGGASATDEGAGGVLSGLTFAVKDNLDLAGHRTGCGNPDWLRTRGGTPAATHAPCVAAIARRGRDVFVGKTQMDELAWALQGENAHYGTPVQPRGSLARSRSGRPAGAPRAVAAALLSTWRSARTPPGASACPRRTCGVYGFRPTHGARSRRRLRRVWRAPSTASVGSRATPRR